MEFIRKFFGIPPPQKYNDGYYHWDPYVEDSSAQEGIDIKVYPQPGNQHPSRFQAEEDDDVTREFQDIERHFHKLWKPFNGGDVSVFELVPEFFAERREGNQVPFLKPGQRADHALDSRAVDGETLMAIMEEDKNERTRQLEPRGSKFPDFFQVPPDAKNFSRSVSIQIKQRPDGVWETRKTVRNGDGEEQVTVKEVSPESMSSFPLQADLGTGQFFGGQDKRGTGIFDRIFGGV